MGLPRGRRGTWPVIEGYEHEGLQRWRDGVGLGLLIGLILGAAVMAVALALTVGF